ASRGFGGDTGTEGAGGGSETGVAASGAGFGVIGVGASEGGAISGGPSCSSVGGDSFEIGSCSNATGAVVPGGGRKLASRLVLSAIAGAASANSRAVRMKVGLARNLIIGNGLFDGLRLGHRGWLRQPGKANGNSQNEKDQE